jgi:hypothetical protein
VFNECARLRFGDQLHCPFHAASLRHPTTLHALVRLLQDVC